MIQTAALLLFLVTTSIHAAYYLQKPTFLRTTFSIRNHNNERASSNIVLFLSDTNDNNDYNSDDWDNGSNGKWEEDSWSSFAEPSNNGDDDSMSTILSDDDDDTLIDDGETFLNTIASISADEINFMTTEADRADKVRQMEEWGFEAETIANTLDVAVDDSAENPDNDMYDKFTEATASGFGMYNDADIDLMTVESHATVEVDEETGETIRSQMVYVDEHTCIGCTNCATVAQSTFFMEEEMGRARVFEQWGDNDETIQIAIETCPVDCIHYVPYEELKALEIRRRNQSINFKARLVSQAEYGGGQNHMTGGATGFTAAPQISGNLKSRCNNCPSNGCGNCPMYGVGKNPTFEKKEKERLARDVKRRMKDKIGRETKSADL